MPVPIPPDSNQDGTTSASLPPPSIDVLLRTVPEKPQDVQAQIAQHPSLASAADSTGYSLLHAASSYGHADLLRELVRTHDVSPNITDLEHETPLFAAESLAMVQLLVEELGADISLRNEEGRNVEDQALENVEEGEGGDWVVIAEYLERARLAQGGGTAGTQGTAAVIMRGNVRGAGSVATVAAARDDEIRPPPPVPEGIEINFGTMEDPAAAEDEPDPEFRRRIEELASREDFQGPEGQAALRDLVRDAMGDVAAERDVRRRRID